MYLQLQRVHFSGWELPTGEAQSVLQNLRQCNARSCKGSKIGSFEVVFRMIQIQYRRTVFGGIARNPILLTFLSSYTTTTNGNGKLRRHCLAVEKLLEALNIEMKI
jgi:hypothetical protein